MATKFSHNKYFLSLLVIIIAFAAAAFFFLRTTEDKIATDNPPQPASTDPDPEPHPLSLSEQLLAKMTIEEKVAQMFVITPSSVDSATPPPSGIIFFAEDIDSKEQLKSKISNLQNDAKYPLLIMTDQEGGLVDRLSKIGVARFGNMSVIGATGDSQEAYKVGAAFGQQMRELGFNVDLAPVADVNTNPKNPVIGVRSFGSDPQLVADMVVQEVKGLQDYNVSAALKHFPGHGDTSTDTHKTATILNKTLDELKTTELIPFEAGIAAGVDLVLAAHIILPKVDPSNLPTTMSKIVITDLLRNDLGYQGIVITDALNMGAIANYYSDEEMILNCINAGIDLLLMPKSFSSAYNAFLNLVKEDKISESRINESVLRILELKEKRGLLIH